MFTVKTTEKGREIGRGKEKSVRHGNGFVARRFAVSKWARFRLSKSDLTKATANDLPLRQIRNRPRSCRSRRSRIDASGRRRRWSRGSENTDLALPDVSWNESGRNHLPNRHATAYTAG